MRGRVDSEFAAGDFTPSVKRKFLSIKVLQGVDNLNGTWKLPGARFASLPAGTYDVKVTAKNAIGLVRADTTTNELTVSEAAGKSVPNR